MRKINKLTPLPHFNGDNYNNNCFIWTCKNCTNITLHNTYQDIYQNSRLQILTDEQNQMCGYTEIYINELEECHIDHYKKREFFPELTFNWDNLIVATKDNDFGANYKDNEYKIQKAEYIKIFNPVIDEVKFKYTTSGEIVETDEKIKKTVEVFNLNYEPLKNRRKKLITTIKSYKDGGLNNDEIKTALNTAGFISVIEQELS